jgi:uncharacterized membrane protein YraQ (UPF0718 family)
MYNSFELVILRRIGMSLSNSIKLNDHSKILKRGLMVLIFIVIAIAGLSYVKWFPYYHKAINAIDQHSIGKSIISGSNSGELSWIAAWGYAQVYFKSIWKAAVLGILLGSLIQTLLPSLWLQRVLGKATFRSTFWGGVASIPGMMCSCCAAPIAASLRKRNASIGASLAFWIGNPVLNPATLVFMTFVLSWKFTLIRIIYGLLLTFGVSYWANRLTGRTHLPEQTTPESAQAVDENGPFLLRWMKSLGVLLLQIVPVYVITVLVLGALQGWMFPVSMGTGFIAIMIFAIAGMLFVIPTAAEIPIIQTFLALGLGMGPAAALLVALPAVSLPSLFMVARSFPRKVLVYVALSVVVVSILSGVTGILLL